MTNSGISKKQQKYVSEADCSGQFHGSHLIGLECVCSGKPEGHFTALFKQTKTLPNCKHEQT